MRQGWNALCALGTYSQSDGPPDVRQPERSTCPGIAFAPTKASGRPKPPGSNARLVVRFVVRLVDPRAPANPSPRADERTNERAAAAAARGIVP
eukprot:1193504-Prorocentrum_minimum.AAC.3